MKKRTVRQMMFTLSEKLRKKSVSKYAHRTLLNQVALSLTLKQLAEVDKKIDKAPVSAWNLLMAYGRPKAK